jgi:hypothetical protein
MSAAPTDHAADEVAHAHDPAEELAHAREHARENMFIFFGFFGLVLLNVCYYEFSPSANIWCILAFAAARAIAIAFFMNWLFKSFSFVFRTFSFTIFFLGGMIFLSMWDSELHHIGNPIKLPDDYGKTAAPKSS